MIDLPEGYIIDVSGPFTRIVNNSEKVPRAVVYDLAEQGSAEKKYGVFVRRSRKEDSESHAEFPTMEEALRYGLAQLLLG